MNDIFATAWKEGARTIRCSFFEVIGSRNCPFHEVKLSMGVTIVGPIYMYAAKRTKRGTRGSYKRRKKRGKRLRR